MPLFLVSVKRKRSQTEYGEFSIEADDVTQARARATAALASGEPPDISWDGCSGASHGKAQIDEVEILANGTEDIRESFE